MKTLFVVLGSVAVVLAAIGLFVPLLPTTPFLLLASACYLRGSKRLHSWLTHNRLFGEHIRNIENKNGIPLKAKIVALIFLWVSLAFSIYTVNVIALKIALSLLGLCVSVYIWFRLKTLKMPSHKSHRLHP